MTLYNFSKLEAFLDKNNYPAVSKKSGFQVIKKDLTKEENAGNVEYKSDGIYVNINGQMQKGYLYLKFPNVSEYGYPKVHLVECKTIKEQKQRGRFINQYFWFNGSEAEIIDRKTKKKETVSLGVCGNCKSVLNNCPSNTITFHQQILALYGNQVLEEEVSVDINGYHKNWKEISKKYRTGLDYTCENCSIKIENSFDKRYIHTDHIDGNKLNNHPDNLQALCVLCHSEKDKLHQENFDKTRMQKELNAFLEKYRDELEQVNNPYL